MSYDIRLMTPDGETAQLPCGFAARGGTVPAAVDPLSGALVQVPVADAAVNVTYNYSRYYYEATGSADFPVEIGEDGGGIRCVYGLTPEQSIPALRAMVDGIMDRYLVDGVWVDSERERRRLFDDDGSEVSFPEMLSRGLSDGDLHVVVETYTVSEGDLSDYWEATAANAIAPLEDMLRMATLMVGVDCVWDGD